MQAQHIDASTLKQWLDNDEAVLIDVREPAEHKTANIPGATLKPLSTITTANLASAGNKKVVIHCQKGARGGSACQKLLEELDDDSALEIYNLEGGLEAWQRAGLPLGKSGGKVLPLDRQVQLTLGSLVLMFGLLGYFIDANFSLIAGLLGAGLMTAGLTGWCGLARLMAIMPWNR